jgi:predicted TIM-barrel fold metal-dependent hydrolase
MAVQKHGPESEIPEEAFNERIIDLDFHMNPSEEDLRRYIDNERVLDKLSTELGLTPNGAKWDAAYAISEGNEGIFTQGRAETPSDVYEAASKFAIDEPIVNAAINKLPTQHNPVLKNAIVNAANDYLRHEVIPEDLYCLITVPSWDPEFAAEEIERNAQEDGFIGAYSWFGSHVLWGGKEFDPIFEALEKHDLPLVLHVCTELWPKNTPIGDGMLTWTEMLGFDTSAHCQVNAANMIMSGVFDKFPDLNVVFEEGGHWWTSSMRYRLDEFYEMHPDDIQVTPRKFESGERLLERKPSEYLRDNVYVTTQPLCPPERVSDLKQMLEQSMAEDMFLYSSDWPHQTIDPATWAFDNPAFDETLRKAILRENAEQLFGI